MGQFYEILQQPRIRFMMMATGLLTLVCFTILVDFLYARMAHTSFYISESLLFSAFWLMYFPLLNLQWRFSGQCKKLSSIVLQIVILVFIHLFAFPILVWALSKLFYDHTFAYWQTFSFGLTTHLLKLIVVYTLIAVLFRLHRQNLDKQSQTLTAPIQDTQQYQQQFTATMLVADTNNKAVVIRTADILFCSANPPYVNIHHKTKNYLHNLTLRSMEGQLDNSQFVRIHKSYIVNIDHVISYQSRLNNDYDLIMSDQTSLRVSRNYAVSFKATIKQRQQLTTK